MKLPRSRPIWTFQTLNTFRVTSVLNLSDCSTYFRVRFFYDLPIGGLGRPDRKMGKAQQLSLGIDSRNHLYRGDCLGQLDNVEDESVDLVYIDPPFYSQRYYETFWGEDAAERYAFEDRWKGGIETYLNYLMERVRKLHAKLKPTGTIYVHLDWHISHYVKVQMDKLFGYNDFLNEIVWCYETGGRSTSSFPKKHDTILRYGKTKDAKS
jgi:DNA modification methylase